MYTIYSKCQTNACSFHLSSPWVCSDILNFSTTTPGILDNCVSPLFRYCRKYLVVPSSCQGCCKKVPKWLKTTGIYFLTVLEASSLKSRCWQSHAPFEVSRGKSSLTSSQVVGSPWCSLSYRHIILVSASVFTRYSSLSFLPNFTWHSPFCVSLLIMTPAMQDQGPTLLQYDLILAKHTAPKFWHSRWRNGECISRALSPWVTCFQA